MRSIARSERGFTLMEVMVATSLLTLVVGSMFVLLADYNQLLREAQERNVFTSLRRTVIQNLNRRDAWIVTYQQDNSFSCLLEKTMPAGCGATPQPFTVYSSRYPPTQQSVVFSNFNPPSFTTYNWGRGFTINGSPCTTFDEVAPMSDTKALRCPIRLEVTWQLKTFGIPHDYYPTGYFPSGYYINTTAGAYFPGATGTYFWYGTLGAQVEVRGVFKVHQASIGKKVNLNNYDFKLIKHVP